MKKRLKQRAVIKFLIAEGCAPRLCIYIHGKMMLLCGCQYCECQYCMDVSTVWMSVLCGCQYCKEVGKDLKGDNPATTSLHDHTLSRR